ncbi:MAG: hypothetical protein ACTHM1_03875 [Solirubrobacteraceae bacterium]
MRRHLSCCRAALRGSSRPAVLPALLAGALLAVVPVSAGCGGIVSPDLFVVQRTGSTPGARLTLLLSEEGIAHCNGGPPRRIGDAQLIKARTIQENLHGYAVKHESLPAAPGSVLSYYVRDVDGSVRFSDNSPHQPHVMREMALLVLTLARDACHLPQSGA